LLEPDIAFVQHSRVPRDVDAYPELAPDLVVEVASPSQTGPSIEEKTSSASPLARLIWAVDPVRRAVRVRRPDGTDRLLTEQDVLDGGDVLPGFRLPVGKFFA
jgi:Uma2 family endonuclease